MHIVVRHPRHLPVNHHRDFRNIQTSTSYVRRDQQWDGLFPERLEGLETVGLGEVGVEGGARDGSGELREKRVEERGGAAVRDEEDGLGKNGGRVFLRGGALALVVAGAAGG